MQLFQINQSEESSKITINAHTTSFPLHELPITDGILYIKYMTSPVSSCQSSGPIAIWCFYKTVNHNLYIDTLVFGAWCCSEEAAATERFQSGVHGSGDWRVETGLRQLCSTSTRHGDTWPVYFIHPMYIIGIFLEDWRFIFPTWRLYCSWLLLWEQSNAINGVVVKKVQKIDMYTMK